jgi:hypothetical protein
MVHLAQLAGRADAKGPHEVRHIEPVGATGAGALLFCKPDLFLGDGSYGDQGRREDLRRVVWINLGVSVIFTFASDAYQASRQF